ncbi:MAG TPA: hypothetical protein DCS93_32750 [Microscillaceae bacterium]|nr:hypothetical protein [Microscillaceae bacterium]
MQKITTTMMFTWVCLLGLELSINGTQAYAQDCKQPLSQSIFNQHKQQLKQESFEEDRMKMATTFLQQKRCMKVSQIKTVIQMLNFEDNQLTFAKMAYKFAHDPENYQQVVAIFTEAPTRKTLTRYINKQK